jgi:hypothetical protein
VYALALAASIVAPPVELGWRAPAECPGADVALRTIDALLEGHAPADDRRIAADVVIERGGAGFRASVRVDDGENVGERELESASCEEVADAAALIVAMAVDPRIGGAPPSEGETEAPPVEPIPAPPPASTQAGEVGSTAATEPVAPPACTTAAPAERERPRKRPPLHLVARAAGGVGYGSVPTVAGVVMIALALAGPRWRVELDVDVWTPRTREAPGGSGIGVRVLGWTLGVRGCGSALAGRLEVPVCAGIRSGALHGSGVGPVASQRRFAPWVVATIGSGVWGWITPRFALALDVDGIISLTTPAFDLQPSGFTVRTPLGGVRALFGPVLRWP